MKINLSIFKEYDVRGLYPSEINEKTAYELGGAFVAFLGAEKGAKIAVGRDGRKSSKPLAESFIKGITDAGIDVIEIGKATTPMLYFSVCSLRIAGGAMITASHNPSKYNGVKFCKEKAKPVSGTEMKVFFEDEGKTKKKLAAEKGAIKKINIEKAYNEKVYDDFSLPKKVSFSHSFDKDADRLIVTDKKGVTARGDLIGMLVGEAAVKKGNTIIYDLRCSRAVPKHFRSKGIRAIPSKAGHFNIKNAMRKYDATFGMEITGHYYFKKLCYCESPELALKKLVEQLKKEEQALSSVLKRFEGYHHSGVIDIPVKDLTDSDWEKKVEALKKEYSYGAMNFMDGITIEFSNWWLNLRQSHTEPLLRLTVEANSETLLEEKKAEIMEMIK